MITTTFAGSRQRATPALTIDEPGWGNGQGYPNGANCWNPSFFVQLVPLTHATHYRVQMKAPGAADWVEVQFSPDTLYIANVTVGGAYQFRYRGEAGAIIGAWSETLTYYVLPASLGLSFNKSCNVVTLNWSGGNGVTHFELYRNGTFIITTTNSSYTETLPSGSYTYELRGFVSSTCYTPAQTFVTVTAPTPAGTLLSSGCVGSQTVATYANGACGTYTGVITSWNCSGCYNIITGNVGGRYCQGSNVQQNAYTGTCTNVVQANLIEVCAHGCSNGACLAPPITNCRQQTAPYRTDNPLQPSYTITGTLLCPASGSGTLLGVGITSTSDDPANANLSVISATYSGQTYTIVFSTAHIWIWVTVSWSGFQPS